MNRAIFIKIINYNYKIKYSFLYLSSYMHHNLYFTLNYTYSDILNLCEVFTLHK